MHLFMYRADSDVGMLRSLNGHPAQDSVIGLEVWPPDELRTGVPADGVVPVFGTDITCAIDRRSWPGCIVEGW